LVGGPVKAKAPYNEIVHMLLTALSLSALIQAHHGDLL